MRKLKFLNFMLIIALFSVILNVPVNGVNTNICFYDDFSEYSSSNDLFNNYTFYNVYNSGVMSENDMDFCELKESDAEHGKSIYIWKPQKRDNTRIDKQLDRVYEGGNVEIKYAVKPSEINTTLFWIFDKSAEMMSNGVSYIISMFNPNGAGIRADGSGKVLAASYTPGIWHYVTAKFDLDNGTCSIYIEDENGTVVCNTTGTHGLKNIGKFAMQIWTQEEGGSYFDDISIKVTDDSVIKDSKLPYSNDFSNGMTGLGQPWGYKGSGIVDYDEEHGKVFKLSPGTDGTWPAFTFEPGIIYSSGKIGIKLSVKPDKKTTASISEFISKYDSAQGKHVSAGNAHIIEFKKEGIITVAGESLMSFSDSMWYDVYLNFDMGAQKYDVYIKGEDGSASCKTVNYYTNGFRGMFLQIRGGNDNPAVYADDLSITKSPQDIPLAPAVTNPIEDSFEYNDLDDMDKNWDFMNNTKSLSKLEESAAGGGKSYYLGLDSATNNTWAMRSLGNVFRKGKIKVSLDVIPGENISTHIIMGKPGGSVFTLIFFDPEGNVLACTSDPIGKIGKYTIGNKYHIEGIIDFDNETLDISYEDDIKLVEKTGLKYNEIAGSRLFGTGAFGVQVWKETDSGSYFDNLKVEYVTEAPVISAGDVKMYRGSAIQKDTSAVAPGTDKIELNFHAVMDDAAMADNLVTLKDNATDKLVSFVGTAKGNIYTLKLEEGLKPDRVYTLSVNQNVKNLKGEALGKDFVYNFGTDAGHFDAHIISAVQGGIDIGFDNSTGSAKNMTIIYGYYNNNTLVKTTHKKVTINAGESGSYTHTNLIESPDSADRVKIMLWDGINDMKPLGEYWLKEIGAGDRIKLQCDENGDFTILIIADPQGGWSRAAEELKVFIEKADPDLVLINGDVAGNNNWLTAANLKILVKPLEERNIPWTIVNGNHDPYSDVTWNVYRGFDNCIVKKVSSDDENYVADRPINYVHTIYSNDGETPVFAVWGMDTGGYTSYNDGTWDTITQKQLKWYNAESEKLKGQNGGNPVTGLMCFHIALPQLRDLYNNKENYITYGTAKGIGATQPRDDSGLYEAIVRNGDIKAVISGHDHENNFIGSYNGILIGYAGKAGGSYGGLSDTTACGGRIIKINQSNPEKFTTEWIATDNGTDQPPIYSDGNLAE